MVSKLKINKTFTFILAALVTFTLFTIVNVSFAQSAECTNSLVGKSLGCSTFFGSDFSWQSLIILAGRIAGVAIGIYAAWRMIQAAFKAGKADKSEDRKESVDILVSIGVMLGIFALAWFLPTTVLNVFGLNQQEVTTPCTFRLGNVATGAVHTGTILDDKNPTVCVEIDANGKEIARGTKI
jgi:hypothetical protein